MTDDVVKKGRPRDYATRLMDGFANAEATGYVGALDELSDRLFDLIEDLPPDILMAVPAGAANSVASLATHIAWAEAHWISRATGDGIPADLDDQLSLGRLQSSDRPGEPVSADQVIACCRRVRNEITKSRVSLIDDIDVEIDLQPKIVTVRGMLINQLWHWTYHTGQVGLIRRLTGARYKWNYGDRIAP